MAESLTNSRILLVDDNLQNLQLLGSLLKMDGYRPVFARSGREALDYLEKKIPDLILLDVMMPGMDGFTVCKKIKQFNRLKEIPIIFLTAKTDPEFIVRGFDVGGVEYIPKPFNHKEVLVRIKNHLRINQLTNSLIAANRELKEKQTRLDNDLKAAAQIQRSLIPRKTPNVKGFQFAWEFLPCERIGGDIFNVFQLDENHLAIYVIDVSGHGVPAAMITVSVSQTLFPQTGSLMKKQIKEPPFYEITSPAEVLTVLDRTFPFDRFNRFFTIAYLVIDISSGNIRYSRGGHPVPVLIRKTGDMEFLESGGTVIGLDGTIPFEEGNTTINPGDRLFTYTDGIVEHKNSNEEEFGVGQFYKELKKFKNLPLDVTCQRLIASLKDHGHQNDFIDDVTLFGIEVW